MTEPMSEGVKHDADKVRFDLLPRAVLRGIAAVMTFGARKYSAYNWQLVELERYLSAADRHLNAALSGEALDPESGEHHAWHYACNAMFIAWLLAYRPEQAREYYRVQTGLSQTE